MSTKQLCITFCIILSLLFGAKAGTPLGDRPVLQEGQDPTYPAASVPFFSVPRNGTTHTCGYEENCQVPKIGTWDVFYQDGITIRFCLCGHSGTEKLPTLDWTIYHTGRLYSPQRSSIVSIVLEQGDPSAYAGFGSIFIVGPEPNLSLIAHESGHSYDFAQGDFYGSLGISQGGAYGEASDQDSCASDPYSRTNLVENFAQLATIRHFAYRYGVTKTDPFYDCMKHVYEMSFDVLDFPSIPVNPYKNIRISPASNYNATVVPFAQGYAYAGAVQGYNFGWKIIPAAPETFLICQVVEEADWCLDNNRNTDDGALTVSFSRNAFFSMQHEIIQVSKGVYQFRLKWTQQVLGVNCPDFYQDYLQYTLTYADDNCTHFTMEEFEDDRFPSVMNGTENEIVEASYSDSTTISITTYGNCTEDQAIFALEKALEVKDRFSITNLTVATMTVNFPAEQAHEVHRTSFLLHISEDYVSSYNLVQKFVHMQKEFPFYIDGNGLQIESYNIESLPAETTTPPLTTEPPTVPLSNNKTSDSSEEEVETSSSTVTELIQSSQNVLTGVSSSSSFFPAFFVFALCLLIQ